MAFLAPNASVAADAAAPLRGARAAKRACATSSLVRSVVLRRDASPSSRGSWSPLGAEFIPNTSELIYNLLSESDALDALTELGSLVIGHHSWFNGCYDIKHRGKSRTLELSVDLAEGVVRAHVKGVAGDRYSHGIESRLADDWKSRRGCFEELDLTVAGVLAPWVWAPA